ncbi:hypothetical protein V8C37DRAFT_394085 [Trichoderma ceciliae]
MATPHYRLLFRVVAIIGLQPSSRCGRLKRLLGSYTRGPLRLGVARAGPGGPLLLGETGDEYGVRSTRQAEIVMPAAARPRLLFAGMNPRVDVSMDQ